MKTYLMKRPGMCPSQRKRQRGFALIVTLSLMILLVIVAVGLLSISTISLRSAANGGAEQIARQNARLALVLAIGELQKELGPDQRISANASILDSSPETPDIDGVENPQWMGAWTSWVGKNHFVKQTDNASSLVPDTSENRKDSFRRWLVSIPETGDDDAVDINYPKDYSESPKGTSPKAVTLVGEGTSGNSSSEVNAPLVNITSGINKGGYSWWVGDASQKATIRPGREDNDLSSPLAALAESDSPSTVGWDLLGMTTSGSMPDHEELVKGSLSQSTLALMTGMDKREVKENYHTVGAEAKSVIADVREGGLKRDFNLLGEAYSADIDSPGALPVNEDNMLYDVGDGNRVPLHDLLNYYSIYKAQKKGGPGNVLANIGGRPGLTPMTAQEFNSAAQGQITNIYRQPVLLRVQFAIRGRTTQEGASSGKYRLKFQFCPYITLWNPYSVPMKLNGDLKVRMRGMQVVLAPVITGAGALDGNQTGATTTLTGITNGRGDDATKTISDPEEKNTMASLLIDDTSVFQPGEVRVYSAYAPKLLDLVNRGSTKPYILMKPGYKSLNGCEVDYERLQVSQGGSGNNKLEFFGSDVVECRVALGTTIVGDGLLKDGQMMAVEVTPNGLSTALNGYHTQALHFPMSTSTSPPPINSTLFNYNNSGTGTPPKKTMSDLATSEGLTFLLFSYGFAGEEEARVAGTSSFRSRPFLHSMATHATPWVEDASGQFLYDQGMRWSVKKDSAADNEISVTGASGEYGKYGAGWSIGQKNVIQVEIPQRPFHSLAQFAHASLGGWSIARSGPDGALGKNMATTAWGQGGVLPNVSKAIGNSYAHPWIGATSAMSTRALKRSVASGGSAPVVPYADHSYLANYALWDEFFMSSIAGHNGGLYDLPGSPDNYSAKELAERLFTDSTERLPNHNIVPAPGKSWKEVSEALFSGSGVDQDAERIVARYLLLEGGFNVNSTSKEAWKAVLSGLRNKPSVSIPVSAGGLGTDMEDNNNKVPVSTLSIPGGPAISADSSGRSNSSAQEQWVGSFQLADDQVDKLAERIVEQVKLRGPFLSMSDFVNRRLASYDSKKFSLYGALQAAIEDSDLNKRLTDSRPAGSALTTFAQASVGSAANGSNAYIDQASLLHNIDSTIVPRGDTFVIRSYGDARDKGGIITARAWCEATVQRLPDYIDGDDKPETKFDALASNVNKTFGRQLQIVAFRWLNIDEK